MSALAEETNRTVDDIKRDVKALAEEYQKNGDSIPLSYKKAYDKMGVCSEAAEKKMKQSSEDAKEEMVDDAEDIGEAHKKNSQKASDSWKSAFSVLGNVASTGLKVFTAGATAAAAGISVLGTASISAFADTQQLVGGIETLFGTGGLEIEDYAKSVGKSVEDVREEFGMLMAAQKLALNNANDAYKTAGLSANNYMELVTSFAASLKQSTKDELEAAEAANQAVIDMSDNANKMGTSMESIQNAYQGFAKQNYTMLDNLKLGYGGTKEEMQRLLEDAQAVTGIKYDISNLNDVYSAIHVIQAELGITGTTAKEANTTITGSLNATSAAWTNLVAGLADENQDVGVLADNLVDSSLIVVDNLLPRVEIVLGGIGQLIEKLLPIAVQKIPPIIQGILPDIIQSGVDIVTMLVTGAKENLPQIMNTGGELLTSLISGIVTILPTLATVAFDVIAELLTGISDNADEVLKSGSETLLNFMSGIASKIPELLSMTVDAIIAMAMSITEPNTLNNIIEAGIEVLLGLLRGIFDAVPKLLAAVPTIIGRLAAAIIANIPRLLVAAVEIMVRWAAAMVQNIQTLLTAIPTIFTSMVEAFLEMDWGSIGSNIIDGIWNGIAAGWNWLVDSVKSLASSLFGAAKDELDINSPSRKFKWLGEMCVAGWDEGTEDLFDTDTVKKDIDATLTVAKSGVIGANGGVGGGGFTQHIYVNKEVSTPDEVARAIRVESRYGLMGGVAFA